MGKLAAMKGEILGRLLKRPVTDKFPAKPPRIVEGWRGKIDFDYKTCIMCGICARVCPAEAIEMKPVSDKKKAPLFYQDRCVYCGQCAESCPKKCIHLTQAYDNASGRRDQMRVDRIREKAEQVRAEEAAKASGAAAQPGDAPAKGSQSTSAAPAAPPSEQK